MVQTTAVPASVIWSSGDRYYVYMYYNVAAGSAGPFGNTPGKESISALVSQSDIGHNIILLLCTRQCTVFTFYLPLVYVLVFGVWNVQNAFDCIASSFFFILNNFHVRQCFVTKLSQKFSPP